MDGVIIIALFLSNTLLFVIIAQLYVHICSYCSNIKSLNTVMVDRHLAFLTCFAYS